MSSLHSSAASGGSSSVIAATSGTSGSAGSGESAGGSSVTEQITAAITQAIVERRLMPGTKLVEQQLADIFRCSRTLVRQALNQLSRDRLVKLEPARGAFVAEPGVEEARQVFEVRKMLEAAMLTDLCQHVTPTQVRQLRAHLKQEREAVRRTDVPGRTRLLADFHVLLARMQGNAVLAQILTDLLSRSSLIALMYQSSHSAAESQAEHEALVEALEARDKRAVLRLLDTHLGNVEANLRLNPRVQDLKAVLQGEPAAVAKAPKSSMGKRRSAAPAAAPAASTTTAAAKAAKATTPTKANNAAHRTAATTAANAAATTAAKATLKTRA
ncbi:DNA-binding GntR family transcriptional regulator [Roseateles terrae]|uniref:DNA-binding GntR family transcriptional regulator n=1 Tax=Roseateles terrae TaxID=431060 RepID=A0ABR6GY68_9BURK|nr:DNA-binding GntR family transcriptional regulator [Roseateles terrae]